jgi:AAA family ATP:ADP antiporter
LISWIPGKLIGWVSYVIFESFGALAPALFWSFVASYTTTSSAKKGYGMILSITQIGTISGTLFIANFSQKLGLPIIILVATFFIMLVPFVIRVFLSVNKVPVKSFIRTTNKPKTGFLEGLRLLLKQPYLLGIFIITTGYEVIGTFLEYQMSILAHKQYPTKEMFTAFYGRYGFFTNGLTLIFALVGTSFFLRKLGLRICLLLFPIATGIIIFNAKLFPILPVIFVSMVLLKGLSYALNNPSKEILYIPTSRDVKFKAKGWIDIFGVRSIKASGAGINAFFRKLAPAESIAYATPILLGVVSLWLVVARLTGVRHHELIEDKKIIK